MARRRNARRDDSDCAVLYRTRRCGHGRDDQRAARPGEEPDSYSRDLRTNRPDSRDTPAYSRAGSGVCDTAPGEGHGGDDDSRCGRSRDCGAALRCGAQRVSRAARGGTGGKSRAPCEGPDYAARCFHSRGRRGHRTGQGEFENQQQRHARGPHADLAGGSRQRSGLGSKYQREWASGEWKRCHNLWPVCGASPEIPGSMERQRREDLFLSVRDSLRSSEPGKLYECAGREWLGLVQAGGWSDASRGMGARHLQRLHLSECDTDPRDRDAEKSASAVPRHHYRGAGQSRRDQPRDRRYGPGNRDASSRNPEGDRLSVSALPNHHQESVVGGPGAKTGYAASDATVLFDYTPTPLELARESTASKRARRPRTLMVEQFRLLVSHLRSQDARSDVRVLWPTHQRGTRVEVGGCRLVDCFTLRNSSQVPYLRKVVIPLAARTRILQSSRQHQFASRSQVGLEPHEPGTEPVARPQA